MCPYMRDGSMLDLFIGDIEDSTESTKHKAQAKVYWLHVDIRIHFLGASVHPELC